MEIFESGCEAMTHRKLRDAKRDLPALEKLMATMDKAVPDMRKLFVKPGPYALRTYESFVVYHSNLRQLVQKQKREVGLIKAALDRARVERKRKYNRDRQRRNSGKDKKKKKAKAIKDKAAIPLMDINR